MGKWATGWCCKWLHLLHRGRGKEGRMGGGEDGRMGGGEDGRLLNRRRRAMGAQKRRWWMMRARNRRWLRTDCGRRTFEASPFGFWFPHKSLRRRRVGCSVKMKKLFGD